MATEPIEAAHIAAFTFAHKQPDKLYIWAPSGPFGVTPTLTDAWETSIDRQIKKK
jgi:TRAP-type mannitol/chloroaromatic compound transport system substrate-binding protein